LSSRATMDRWLPDVSDTARSMLTIHDAAKQMRSAAVSPGQEASVDASLAGCLTSPDEGLTGREAVEPIDTGAARSASPQRDVRRDAEVPPGSEESNARPVVDRNESLSVPSAISWRRWLLLLSAVTVEGLTAHGRRWVTRIKVKNPRSSSGP
jgi:hypothetical protein